MKLDARILALRAGFDVLFGGAETRELRERFSALLDPPDAPRTAREWDDHHGNHRAPFDLTDLEWWFQSFALLRNKIAHGGQLESEEYDFDDGTPYVWHAERNLRRAIKQTVADAGHEDVLLDAFDRVVRQHTDSYSRTSPERTETRRSRRATGQGRGGRHTAADSCGSGS